MPKKMFRAGLVLSLLLFGCVAGAQAQETIKPDKRALIKEFLEVMGATKTTDAIVETMLQQQEKEIPKLLSTLLAGKVLTADEQAASEQKIRESSQRIGKKIRESLKRMNFGQMADDITASLFDKYFTETDLKEMIAFYKSPVGKKAIELMPVLFAESMTKGNEVLFPKLQEEVTKIMTDEVKQLEQEFAKMGQTPQPPAKSKKRRRQ
jgi:uncharacterized protein